MKGPGQVRKPTSEPLEKISTICKLKEGLTEKEVSKKNEC